MHPSSRLSTILGAIFLVAGTAIGAGMLATPVITAHYGFGAAVGLFVVCWVMMSIAALLMLEVNLWLPERSHMVSMAQATLGKTGGVVAWVTYLLLLYTLMVAYISGVGDLFTWGMNALFSIHLPTGVGAAVLVVLLLGVTFIGMRATDYCNRLLMAGLMCTYMVLLFFLVPHIEPGRLLVLKPDGIWHTLPVIVTTFGFQIVIPSLRHYLKGEVGPIRWSILIGSLIPLLIYIIWEALIVGVLPLTGDHGLVSIAASGQTVNALVAALGSVTQHTLITGIPHLFIFCAISTSFVGVSLSLFDFLADALPQRLHTLPLKGGDVSVAALTFIPPTLFALCFPHIFIQALAYGGILVALLLVLLPALMVWRGRYTHGFGAMATDYKVWGGRAVLLLVILFAVGVILIQLQEI